MLLNNENGKQVDQAAGKTSSSSLSSPPPAKPSGRPIPPRFFSAGEVLRPKLPGISCSGISKFTTELLLPLVEIFDDVLLAGQNVDDVIVVEKPDVVIVGVDDVILVEESFDDVIVTEISVGDVIVVEECVDDVIVVEETVDGVVAVERFIDDVKVVENVDDLEAVGDVAITFLYQISVDENLCSFSNSKKIRFKQKHNTYLDRGSYCNEEKSCGISSSYLEKRPETIKIFWRPIRPIDRIAVGGEILDADVVALVNSAAQVDEAVSRVDVIAYATGHS
uniref:Uncharacterized protein n=1 Tax=Romanomermis culicivorax TaxID=13658 RepID=A0A915JFJ6_ROMCU